MFKFKEEHEHLDTELNFVPIIDCFVMLICFLLFTAAFTQLVFLEAKITSNTAAAAQKSRSEMDQFRLVITFEDGGMRLATTGSAAKTFNMVIPKTGGDYDFKSLHSHLISLKSDHPERYSADIEFKQKNQNNMNYDQLVKTMDQVRHLTDEEYGALRIAQKKIRKLELGDKEKEKEVPEKIGILAQVLLDNEIAKNADHKVLFPDIALVGMD